jgi:hypothetical protein
MSLHDLTFQLGLHTLYLVRELDIQHGKVSYAEVVLDLDVFDPWAFYVNLVFTLSKRIFLSVKVVMCVYRQSYPTSRKIALCSVTLKFI